MASFFGVRRLFRGFPKPKIQVRFLDLRSIFVFVAAALYPESNHEGLGRHFFRAGAYSHSIVLGGLELIS